MAACTHASHEATKLVDATWRALPYVGVQFGELEMRNCTCGSTLCRPIVTAFYLSPTHIRYITADGEHHIIELLPGRTDTCPDWLLEADDRHALFAGYETEEQGYAASDAAFDHGTEAA